jgi:hypothetical protein
MNSRNARLPLVAWGLWLALTACAHTSSRQSEERISIWPVKPIQGDPISVTLPLGGCSWWDKDFTSTREEDGVTHLAFRRRSPGDCDGRGSGGHSIPLGRLPEGHYRLTAEKMEYRFTVRPEGTPVPPLSDENRAAAAVLLHFKPRFCFGMPGGNHWGGSSAREEHPELWRQLAADFPDLEVQEREILSSRLNAVELEPLGQGQFRYRFRDGQCCTIRTQEGIVTILPGIRIHVGEARTLEEETVPC